MVTSNCNQVCFLSSRMLKMYLLFNRSKTFEVGDRDSQRLSICRSNRTIEKENLLLSDIFFKTHSFSDNELMIFNEKNCKNQKDGHLCKWSIHDFRIGPITSSRGMSMSVPIHVEGINKSWLNLVPLPIFNIQGDFKIDETLCRIFNFRINKNVCQ